MGNNCKNCEYSESTDLPVHHPVSKRLVKKSGYVAEISSIFLQDGVGGASKINNIETLTKDEPQIQVLIIL